MRTLLGLMVGVVVGTLLATGLFALMVGIVYGGFFTNMGAIGSAVAVPHDILLGNGWWMFALFMSVLAVICAARISEDNKVVAAVAAFGITMLSMWAAHAILVAWSNGYVLPPGTYHYSKWHNSVESIPLLLGNFVGVLIAMVISDD